MAVTWIPGSCPRFEISDEVLAERAARIKPAITVDDALCHQLYLIEDVDLRRTAFTWDPKPTQPVGEAYEIARIETSHTCGYIAMFKPSIAEVLAQIPEHLLSYAKWFRTLTGDTVTCYADGDGHRTITILYSDKPLGA